MGWLCTGSDHAEETVPLADDSAEIEEISVPCTEDKIMYITDSGEGFWLTRETWNTSGTKRSLPMNLKVQVDGPKSCRGERYYFTILEGPLVERGEYVSVIGTRTGNVVKTFNGLDTLTSTNPHTSACNLVVKYVSHSVLEYNGYITVSVIGELNYDGVSHTINMTGDLIKPNVDWNVFIPDFPHNYGYNATYHHTWFRIDAPTTGVNFVGEGDGNDRYLHLGRGSAGCFTFFAPDKSTSISNWDDLVVKISRCRDGSNKYIGTIKLEISDSIYTLIHSQLIAEARIAGLSYVFDHKVNTP